MAAPRGSVGERNIGIIDIEEYKNADAAMKAEFVNRLKSMDEVWTFSRTTSDLEALALREELRKQGIEVKDRTFIVDLPGVLSKQMAVAGPHAYFYFGSNNNKKKNNNVIPENVTHLPLVASAPNFIKSQKKVVSHESDEKVSLDDLLSSVAILTAEEESLTDRVTMDMSVSIVTRLNDVRDAITSLQRSFAAGQLTYSAINEEFTKLGIEHGKIQKQKEHTVILSQEHATPAATVGRDLAPSEGLYREAMKILISEILRLAKDYKINIGKERDEASIIKFAHEVTQGSRAIPMDKTTEAFSVAVQREHDLLSAVSNLATQHKKGFLTEKDLVKELKTAEDKMAPTKKHAATFGRLYKPSKTSAGQEKIQKARLAIEKKISKLAEPAVVMQKTRKK